MTNRMNPIFGRGLSLQLRLFVAVLLSVAGIVADARFHLFSDVRIYMDSMVSPLLYLADSPRQLADGVSEQLQSRSQLLDENQKLEQQLFLLRSDLLRLNQVTQENERLRNAAAGGKNVRRIFNKEHHKGTAGRNRKSSLRQ